MYISLVITTMETTGKTVMVAIWIMERVTWGVKPLKTTWTNLIKWLINIRKEDTHHERTMSMFNLRHVLDSNQIPMLLRVISLL